MGCRIEALMHNLPKPQLGPADPVLTRVREIRDLSGTVVFDEGEHVDTPEYTILRFALPVPTRVARDLSAAIDVATWWPTLKARILEAITSANMAYAEQDAPVAEDGGSPVLVCSVIAPIPSALLNDERLMLESRDAIAQELLDAVQDGVALQLREYQVARRMANDA